MKKRISILAALVLSIALLLIACGNSEQIICSNCSSTNPKDSQFCTNCGTAFFQNSTEATTKPMENTAPTSGDQEQSTEPTQAPTEPTKPQPTQPQPTTPSHTHSYSAATCTSPKTCSCGATSGSALGHSWNNATCTSPKKCSRCGTSTGSVTSHNYTKNTTPATCSSQGYTTYTCSSCGDSYKDNYVTASHNYQNYKCTSCGAVDKAHAYEYLIEWVKANGVANGDHIGITEDMGDGTTQTITYNATGDYLYVSCFRNGGTPNDDSDDTFCVIDLSSSSQEYYYFCSHGYTPVECESYGQFSASSYTDASPLPYEKYTGPSGLKSWFLELSRLSVNLNIAFLDGFIDQCIPGISITDLGFTSW